MPENERIYQSDPLGLRAVKLGLITRHDVETALQTQNFIQVKSDHLADVLVDLGFLDSTQYHEVLVAVLDVPATNTEEGKDAFCALAQEKGYITEENIEAARRASATRERRRKLLGQILVELGVLSSEQLEKVLATYG